MENETGKSDSDGRATATIRILIDFDQFRSLVAGAIVDVNLIGTKVQIALEDIGYPQMLAAVAEALSDDRAELAPADEPEDANEKP